MSADPVHDMRQNIFLIGFMGAGKTTVAQALRDRHQMQLIEMDDEIEAREERSVAQIFAEDGEDYFRALETALLKSMHRQENTVVSCGGGVPMREANVEAMRRCGSIVYLSASPETIFERVRYDHTRPLLEGHMDVDYIAALMDQRLPRYLSAADITVRTDRRSVQEICDEIYAYINR